jgi:hypothetical protein
MIITVTVGGKFTNVWKDRKNVRGELMVRVLSDHRL